MEYKSPVVFLGLPLLHVAMGRGAGAAPVRVARGWIAIGDVALGGVALGGVAVGVCCVGGVSAGVVAVAGAALGCWSVGGLALGVFAAGGAAIGLVAATGGLATALDYAVGGVAAAAHANDEIAREYFRTGGFFRSTDALKPYTDWIIAVVVGLVAAAWALRRGDASRRAGAS